MTTFLLDVWHDLREKRLWPVAVGLLMALVALPLVFLKPVSSESSTPPAAAAPTQSPTLPAVVVDSSPTHGSKLQTFSRRNPFKPLADLAKDQTTASGGSPSTTTTTSSSAPVAPKASAGGGAGTSPATSPSQAGGTPASSGGGSAPTSSPSSTPGTSSPSTSTTTQQTVQWFRYTADVRFGPTGQVKTVKGIKSLTLLPPDAKTAVVVFMGVASDAKHAIFFVADPTFAATGEGKCSDKSACRFVKLSLDASNDDEKFTSADGSTTYRLRLVGLHRQLISSQDATGDTTPKQNATPGKVAETQAGDASAAVVMQLFDVATVGSQPR